MKVDVAMFREIRMMGAGARVREEEGEVLASISCPIPEERSLVEAKAMALLYSLKWLRDIFVQGVNDEVDCLQLVQAMISSNPVWRQELVLSWRNANNYLNHQPACLLHTHE